MENTMLFSSGIKLSPKKRKMHKIFFEGLKKLA
jgi:hypothetical protein